jgi:hypothetical protein
MALRRRRGADAFFLLDGRGGKILLVKEERAGGAPRRLVNDE